MRAVPGHRADAGAATLSAWPEVWLWPNLLSLDAPAVAVVWQALFARAAELPLSLTERAVLGISVWLVYAGDRWMDVVRGAAPRTARHQFAERTRATLPPVWCAALVTGVAIAWRGLGAAQFRGGIALTALVLIYLALEHSSAGFPRLFSKETAVGVLFTGGVLVALPRPGLALSAQTALAAGGFAALVWANCSAIERWEQGRRRAGSGWYVIVAAALATGLLLGGNGGQIPLGGAVTWAALGLLALESLSPATSVEVLRVAADGMLFAPAALALLFF